VSTRTSIVVLSPSEPFGLNLEVNDLPIAVTGWTALGSGLAEGSGWTGYWRLGLPGDGLEPEASYRLSRADAQADGGVSELTHFTTASGYDKVPGTAPNLRGLRLWRVRYPVDEIGSGNCVFGEYLGFITIDYDPAVVPNTEAASVVQTFRLVPKTGGAEQTFVFSGATPYQGLAPEGDYHPLSFRTWSPELDPSREYCLTIDAFGDGDLARGALRSVGVCATVTELAAPGASLDGTGCGGCGAAPGAPPADVLALLFPLLFATATRRRRVD
jgi:hypothetical protein